MPAHFGATLRVLRTAAGVSATRLAEGIGVSPAYISRVEHGHDAPPTPDRLRAIAAELGLGPDRLLALVDCVRPDAVEWLGESAEGRQLAVELRRRGLGAAQLARVIQLVRSEYPVTDRPLARLFEPGRVLLRVETNDLRRALEVASLRLGDGPSSLSLAEALYASQAARSGAVGAGLLLAHAVAPGAEVRGCLVSLVRPLTLPTPDGDPIGTIVALVGPAEALTGALIEATRLAEPALLARLQSAPDEAAALATLGEHRAD
jgi:PTS system nitrogen regulatory IIA component